MLTRDTPNTHKEKTDRVCEATRGTFRKRSVRLSRKKGEYEVGGLSRKKGE